MPQSKKISIQLGEISGNVFTADTEYNPPKVYDVWNMVTRVNVEWLRGTPRQRALEGRDRPGVGGLRFEARISFRTMLPSQAKAMRDLLNDIFQNPAFPKAVNLFDFEFIPDVSSLGDGVPCVLRSSAYGIRRDLTMGRQVLNMELSGFLREWGSIVGEEKEPPAAVYASEVIFL